MIIKCYNVANDLINNDHTYDHNKWSSQHLQRLNQLIDTINQVQD